MSTPGVNEFREFVDILKTGGGWAVAALFFLMWLRADRRFARAWKDLKDIAVAKVESDVKTERTLEAGNQAMGGVKSRLDEVSDKIADFTNVLRQILLLKTKRLEDGKKPNGDDQ